MCLHLSQPTFGDQQVAFHGGNNSGHLCTRIPAFGYSRASGRWRSDVPPSLPLPPHQLAVLEPKSSMASRRLVLLLIDVLAGSGSNMTSLARTSKGYSFVNFSFEREASRDWRR
uniref:Uncharacterized protein n=1 Tax=Triticum urartu TaxID=4572 RepID=A0A8R7R7T1_TRIUA